MLRPLTAKINSSIEGDGSSVTPRRGSKRSLEEALQSQQKRQRLDANGSLDDSDTESGDFTNFDPTELVKNREGTFVTPKSVSTYLSKHMRRCLTKEEREALFKEHPRPDVEQYPKSIST